MLTQPLFDKLSQLRLPGFRAALEEQLLCRASAQPWKNNSKTHIMLNSPSRSVSLSSLTVSVLGAKTTAYNAT